jgi:CRISPR-associated protein Cmr2
MTIYTAISFAPVQGFIEKSRKLRDLYGASLILSYLSQKMVEEFHRPPDLEVISPGLINVQEGMPNRILIEGFVDRDLVQKSLLKHWNYLLKVCREWVETKVPAEYYWSQKEEQIGKEKGEWERWGSYTWELFWGKGANPQAAMDDLETRKLKRDWTGINWTGESSSLSGIDAIAWNRLGDSDLLKRDLKGELTQAERVAVKQEIQDFYLSLSQSLEQASCEDQPQGKFLQPNERLSIPELVKRLVTRYEDIGIHLGKDFQIDSFSEMVRFPEPGQPGHWTGWFMGDGDEVGKYLKGLDNNADLKIFSEAMRLWGKDFKGKFPKDLGRVVYAGGDDFMGVIYSENPKVPITTSAALKWLINLPLKWKTHEQPINLSMGFVWAGHSIPQRDILQHCREAEKRSKSLDRNRVTIRVVFNSGQFVQWTCPWDYLYILHGYHDRDGMTGAKASWTHLYNDWAQLQARHAIDLKERTENVDDRIALALFDFYFGSRNKSINQSVLIENCKYLTGKEYSSSAIIEWLDGLVKVGWQLCSDS